MRYYNIKKTSYHIFSLVYTCECIHKCIYVDVEYINYLKCNIIENKIIK